MSDLLLEWGWTKVILLLRIRAFDNVNSGKLKKKQQQQQQLSKHLFWTVTISRPISSWHTFRAHICFHLKKAFLQRCHVFYVWSYNKTENLFVFRPCNETPHYYLSFKTLKSQQQWHTHEGNLRAPIKKKIAWSAWISQNCQHILKWRWIWH